MISWSWDSINWTLRTINAFKQCCFPDIIAEGIHNLNNLSMENMW